MQHAIQQSCINKAAVVAADEKEGGVRATLNLGHTFGHAMETWQGYGIPSFLAAVDYSCKITHMSTSYVQTRVCHICMFELPQISSSCSKAEHDV